MPNKTDCVGHCFKEVYKPFNGGIVNPTLSKELRYSMQINNLSKQVGATKWINVNKTLNAFGKWAGAPGGSGPGSTHRNTF